MPTTQILQQPQIPTQQIQQIKNLMQQIKMAVSPQYALNQMLSSNPQLMNIMNLVKQNGGNAQQTFYNLANQMGVDPNLILNALK